ncbi:hypothetical protein NW762_011582 [Fusarium torreyae]|uniref:C2H2-type domain-containing protein n=1 Tax=Fusarium torreyae TaxID=1237075 RepID=A0A9W8V926_9HYPO|nr:hypothetical protein NW762_011582 [Fusarium torreyae]
MSQALPRITITSPNGDQAPVQLFPFPGPESERVPLWQFFAEQVSEPEPAPSSTPTTTFAHDAAQEKEDPVYLDLPDALAEYKAMRVEVTQFVPHQCRFCDKTFKDVHGLRIHLGNKKVRGKFKLACKTAQGLLAEKGVVWDPNALEPESESEVEAIKPAKKKKRVTKK